MNKNFSKYLSWFTGAIGLASGAIAIKEFIEKSFPNAYIWTAVTIVLIALFIFVLLIVINEDFRYNAIKFFKYHFYISRHGYSLQQMKKVYKFNDRINIDYSVKYDIKSNVKDLDTFSDKLRWSKYISVDDMIDKMSAEGNGCRLLSLEPKHNFYVYTLSIPHLNKGENVPVTVNINGLTDENEETEPFLSSGILCKISELILKVEIPKNLVEPTAEYCIYSNYQDNTPAIRKKLEYDEDIKGFKYNELHPIVGYRYVISWKFKNG